MKRYNLLDCPILWPITATLLCVAWAFFFWQVFFVWISWELLHIPMGLGGAIYFVFFTGPVILGSALYEFVSNAIARKMNLSPGKRYAISLLIPFVTISALLIMFCPMDVECSYLQYVFTKLKMK